MRHSKEFNNIYMKVIVCYLLGTQKKLFAKHLSMVLTTATRRRKRKKERKKERRRRTTTENDALASGPLGNVLGCAQLNPAKQDEY